MIIGVPREVAVQERRIALVPESVKRLVAKGFEIHVETAGDATVFPDDTYVDAGARIAADAAALYRTADVVVKVRPPRDHPRAGQHEADLMREGAVLIAALAPYASADAIRRLAARRVTSFALELMPRITVAQDKDILSSMSTIAGYKAVLLAANVLPKLMPMLMTAAGTIKPARVLVLGAGVAGLQAIATARRLGAVVEAFDVRPAVKEQVESLGARFVAQEAIEEAGEGAGGYAKELTAEQQARQRESLGKHIADADVVICTALVPGKRSPVLITRAQAEAMRPGAVVIDLAAEQGGNCELTRAGEVVRQGGVEIHGPVNLASSVPIDASQMFSRNVEKYLLHIFKNAQPDLDLEDELVRAPMVTREGRIVHDDVRAAVEGN